MGLKKGIRNNPAGRPQGAKNKVNAELRVMITDFLNDEFETVKTDFQKLEPKDRLKFFVDLLKFGLPQLQATTMDIDFNKLSHEQLTTIINNLIEKEGNNE